MEPTPRRRHVEQAGCVPLLRGDDGWRVVLVTSTTTGSWSIPKGHIDPGFTPWDAAAQEAREEAGAVGEVAQVEVGSYEHFKYRKLHVVRVYPLVVRQLHDEWDERGLRQRIVLAPDEALERIDPAQRAVLAAAFAWALAADQG